MTTEATAVIGGVDTHKHTHYAAAVDDQGRFVDHQEFPATDPGYQALLSWLRDLGEVQAIGVESTGSFGATLTRALTKAGVRVVEVNRPNRVARRMDGKSDRRPDVLLAAQAQEVLPAVVQRFVDRLAGLAAADEAGPKSNSNH